MKTDKLNLLYIDDLQVDLDVFKDSFCKDFNVFTAVNTEDGLNFLNKGNIHLIISGQKKPKEFLIQSKKTHSDINCILLTDSLEIKHSDELDVWWYLSKSFNKEELKLIIDKAIAHTLLKVENNILNNKLSTRENTLDQLLETTIDGVLTIDENHKIIKTNSAIYKIFNYKKSTLINKPLNLLIPKDNRKSHAKHIDLFHKEGVISRNVNQKNTELFGLTSKGNKIPIEITISKQKTSSGFHYNAFIRDITERRKAEKKIKDSEERFSLALKGANDGLFDRNVTNNTVYFSPRWKEMLGYKDKEIPNEFESWKNLIHNDDKEKAILTVNKFLDSKNKSMHYESKFRLKHKNGSYRHILARGYGERAKTGEVTRIVGTHIDLTEQIIAKNKLKESEKRLKESQKIANLGSYSFDAETKSWTSSTVLDSILGINKNHPKSLKSWINIFHPEHRSDIEKLFSFDTISKKSFNKEFRINRFNDKEERWLLCLGKLEYDLKGNPLSIIGTLQDITERKRAENTLSQFKHIVSNSNDMIAYIDDDFKYVVVNNRYAKAFLLTPQEIIGKTIKSVLGSDFFNTVFKVNANKCLSGEKVNYKKWFVLPGYGKRFIEISYTPYMASDNKTRGMIINGRDVTDQKIADDELRRAKTILEENEKRLLKAESIASMGFLEWNLKTSKITLSDETIKMLGLQTNSKTISPAVFKTIIYSEDVEVVEKSIRLAIKGKIRHNLDHRINGPNGSVVWVQGQADLYLDKSGSPKTLLVTLVNINQRKLAEKELKESNLKFTQLADNTDQVFWIIDATDPYNYNILFINQAFEKIWQHTRKELEDNPELWYNCIHEEDIERIGLAFTNFLNDNGEYNEEYRIRRPDGSIRNIQVNGSLIRNQKDNIVRAIGICRDITEEKIAKNKIKELNENLKALVTQKKGELLLEKSFSDSIINSLPGIFSLFDKNGKHVRWNKNHETVTGYSFEEYKQMSIFELFTRENKVNLLKALSKLDTTDEVNIEANILMKNKEVIPYYFTGMNVQIGNEKYIAGMGIDISTRKKTETELLQKTEELELFNKVMIEREMRVIEMKEEVNKLSQQLGFEAPYPTIWNNKN